MSTQPGPTVVAITGASGTIGSALSEALRARGDRVVHLVRRETRVAGIPRDVEERRWDPQRPTPAATLTGVDAVVHLAAPGIGERRWSKEYKARLREDRIAGTSSIAGAVAGCDPTPRLISASGVGYYGERGSDVLTEESQLGQGFLAELCRDWEAATWRAEEAGASVAHIRTGIVLSPGEGAMGRVVPFARAGLGGPLGSGKQYWSWITLHDHVRALMFLIDHPHITGPVNLTGPEPAPQREVARVLGKQLNRPSVFPAPTPALRVVLGEMASEILASQRALPTVLQEAGFTWDQPDLHSAVAWLLQAEELQRRD